jgi:hypothetical protein
MMDNVKGSEGVATGATIGGRAANNPSSVSGGRNESPTGAVRRWAMLEWSSVIVWRS